MSFTFTSCDSWLDVNNNVDAPKALTQEKLSNTVGSNIDPVMSLRSTIKIAPGKKQTVYYICGFAKSKTQVLDIVEEFNSKTRGPSELSRLCMAVDHKRKHILSIGLAIKCS